jgi:hypothetical protein
MFCFKARRFCCEHLSSIHPVVRGTRMNETGSTVINSTALVLSLVSLLVFFDAGWASVDLPQL